MRIIDSFDRLPVGKYVTILGIDRSEVLSSDDKKVAILAVLTDQTETQVLNMPLPEFRRCIVVSQFLRRPWDGEMTVKPSYKVGGFELVPTRDVSKMVAAQYIDFQELGSDDRNFTQALSVMLVPKGHAYGEGYDFAEVQQAIRDGLMVSDGLAIYAFFLALSGMLIPDSLTYSRKMLRKLGWKIPRKTRKDLRMQIREAVALSQSIGDGYAPSMESARPAAPAGTKHSGSRSLNSSTSSPTGRTSRRKTGESSKNGKGGTDG